MMELVWSKQEGTIHAQLVPVWGEIDVDNK